MERVLDEVSFAAPDMVKASTTGEVLTANEPAKPTPQLIDRPFEKDGVKGIERVLRVEREYVQQQVADIVKDQDLSRYIL